MKTSIDTKSELLNYVKENNVKFVKLTFCDMFGRQRNISVLSSQLEDAFVNGVAIDSSAMTGVGGIDLKLMPVSALMFDLPWRPHSGKVVSVFCNIADIDCKPYACDPMVLLENQVKKLAALGLSADVSTECEFYVFKEEDGKLVPIDNADYCACAPFDKGENLRRAVVLSIEEMGLKPISSHHERGRGQNEIDFESADPIAAARNFVMFKAAVKNVCSMNGALASFMPKPLDDQPGSGLHITIKLEGKNAKAAGKSFAEGILRRYREITCLANPKANSYKRLGKSYKISYGKNRGFAMRIFDDGSIQLRTPDAACNLFAVLALAFAAGREGIENKLELREEGVGSECIFDTVQDAVAFAHNSEWLHEQIPEQLDNILETIKKNSASGVLGKPDRAVSEIYLDV